MFFINLLLEPGHRFSPVKPFDQSLVKQPILTGDGLLFTILV
jgi:hypothetical protein